MPRHKLSRPAALLFTLLVLFVVPAFAQFTASVQGLVQDPTGAGVAKAQIELVNIATGARKIASSDSSGNYRFVSLAPGSYKIAVEATGPASQVRRSGIRY